MHRIETGERTPATTQWPPKGSALPRLGFVCAVCLTDGCSLTAGPDLRDPAVAIAAGNRHSCALTEGGSVWCWGTGENGVLGVGDSPREASGRRRARSPVRVPVSRITRLAAGFHTTCVVRDSGTGLLCWGDNSFGQVNSEDSGFVPMPTEVFSGKNVQDVDLDLGVMCIVADGAVDCRGSNDYAAITGSGELSKGPYPSQYRSVKVDGLSYCAVSSDNRAFCWGKNDLGQVSPETIATRIDRPVQVGDSVFSVTIGRSYGCAILISGPARCWGAGAPTSALDSLQGRFGPPASVVVGGLATWVLSGTGDVLPLGPAHPITGVRGWLPINDDFRALAVAAGYGHACAIAIGGSVWCWGSNLEGELGNGSTEASAVPVKVTY